MPSPAPPSQAAPSPTRPCPTAPSLAVTGLAPPCLAPPKENYQIKFLALPSLALPHQTEPSPAAPSLAVSCPALPSHTKPCRTLPCPDWPGPAKSYRWSPSSALAILEGRSSYTSSCIPDGTSAGRICPSKQWPCPHPQQMNLSRAATSNRLHPQL